jgi:hypothetical protein
MTLTGILLFSREEYDKNHLQLCGHGADKKSIIRTISDPPCLERGPEAGFPHKNRKYDLPIQKKS